MLACVCVRVFVSPIVLHTIIQFFVWQPQQTHKQGLGQDLSCGVNGLETRYRKSWHEGYAASPTPTFVCLDIRCDLPLKPFSFYYMTFFSFSIYININVSDLVSLSIQVFAFQR